MLEIVVVAWMQYTEGAVGGMHAGLSDELLARYGRLPRQTECDASRPVDAPALPTSSVSGNSGEARETSGPAHSADPPVSPLPVGAEEDDGLTLELPKFKRTKSGRPPKHKYVLQNLVQDQNLALGEQHRPLVDAVATDRQQDDHTELAVAVVPVVSASTVSRVALDAKFSTLVDRCDFPCVDGFMVVPETCGDAVAYIKSNSWPADAVCQETLGMCMQYTRDARALSLNELSDELGIESRDLRTRLQRLAMLKWFWQWSKRLALERVLVSPEVLPYLLLYLEHWRADETPMKVKTLECFSPSVATKDIEKHACLAVMGSETSDRSISVQNSCAVRKLLQCEERFGFVLMMSLTFYLYLAPCVSPLFLLESEKTAVLLQAIARSTCTTRYTNMLTNKLRVATLDGHASNKAAEEHIPSFRPGWILSLLTCELHLLAIVFKVALLHIDRDLLRGNLYTALCFVHGEHMSNFRNCVFQEILQTLVLLIGTPTREAQEYKELMMSLFFSSRSAVKHAMVCILPNGDWRKVDRVEFYVPFGVTDLSKIDKNAVAQFFAVGFIKAFVSEQFNVCALHHWTGYDVAMDQQAGMVACHGLMRRCIRRYLAQFERKQKATSNKSNAVGAIDDTATPLAITDGADAAAASASASAGASHGAAAESDAKTADDWAQVNEKRREEVRVFWQGDPLWRLKLARRVMQPIIVMQQFKLLRAGVGWEIQQQAKVARLLSLGLSTQGGRDYRLLDAAENTAERQCIATLSGLLTDERAWRLYMDHHPAAMTVSGRALGFRMVSRAASATQTCLYDVHEGYPFKAFRVYKHPDLAASILEDVELHKDCKGGYLDPIALWLVKKFNTVATMQSQACRSVLMLMFLVVFCCISALEAAHAFIRRLVIATSVQRGRRTFIDVNIAWLMRGFRLVRSFTNVHLGAAKPERAVQSHDVGKSRKRRKMKRMVKSKGARKRGGCGGAWRAFLRKKYFGCRLFRPFSRIVEASREYAALGFFEKEDLKELGKVAAAAGRKKLSRDQSSFGFRSRDLRREAKINFLRSMSLHAQRVAEDIEKHHLNLKFDRTIAFNAGVGMAKFDEKVARSARAIRMQADADTLVAFSESIGKDAIAAWKRDFPQFDCKDVVAVPTEFGYAIQDAGVSEKVAERISEYVGVASGNSKMHRSPAQLDACFEYFNKPLMLADAPPCMTREASEDCCRVAGMCLCTKDGRLLSSMRLSLYGEVLKPRAPTDSASRLALKDGFWCLVCTGSAGDPGLSDVIAKQVVLHISYCLLSPWRMSWSVQEKTSAPVGELPVSADRMYTKATIVKMFSNRGGWGVVA